MEEKKSAILNKWLEIEFYSVANKANFINQKIFPDKRLIYDTIRCLDYVTTIENKDCENYVITIIALMWEHTDRTQYDLRKVIIKFLSRIGYPTSAIIVDEHYDKSKSQFLALGSYIDQITTTLNQEENEVEVSGRNFLLTDFQKKIWESMDDSKLIGISAPTSAGKSFVILIKIIEKLSTQNYDVVYIVPTLSLLNQVTEDFNRELKLSTICNYKISNSFTPHDEDENNYIYVLTQEKAIAAFSNEVTAFSRKMILVADEIQNIERIKEEKDERAKILFDTLTEFRYKENVEQIVISGPRIEEIDVVGESIFGIETKDLTTTTSPVLNLTYSINKIENKYFFKQYCLLTNEPLIKEIQNGQMIKGYGNTQYNDEYLNYLDVFIDSIGSEEQNIIFAPTSSTARKIACFISRDRVALDTEVVLKELIQYYRESVHHNYSICSTLEEGVAYHHGKLPLHVRRTLEKAIAEKRINNVVCTTTLLQGVNMPAQNVIIRNPNLYLRKTSGVTELSNYEMANLRGRAGRLLKDFVGRTYVLDESAFTNTEGYEQAELFEDVTKELSTGYEERFEEYRSDIEDIVKSGKPVDETMHEFGYLVSYIRQSVLRYGGEAKKRMENVGIKLNQKQVAAIMAKLNQLTVPKEICYKNRYWDPYVLEKIYESYDENVPKTPMERGAKAKLDRMMKFLRDTEETSIMYKRYIPNKFQQGKPRGDLTKLCMQWATEEKLSNILSHERYSDDDGSELIDDTIDTLQNVVSFRVPLLLKPIFDIKNPESVFLTSMQAGAFHKSSKLLIEMGIPRETAIYLYEHMFKNLKLDDEEPKDMEIYLRGQIKKEYKKLPYWIKAQLDFLV